MQRYTEGKLNTSERRVLSTNWVGNALAETGSNHGMVFHRFKNVAFLYLFMVQKINMFILKVLRIIDLHQLMK